MAQRDVYIAIMVAAAKGQGLRLTADEVRALSDDDAIGTRAINMLDETDPQLREGFELGWAKVNPKRNRLAANRYARSTEEGIDESRWHEMAVGSLEVAAGSNECSDRARAWLRRVGFKF